jgi:hypothetical protein
MTSIPVICVPEKFKEGDKDGHDFTPSIASKRARLKTGQTKVLEDSFQNNNYPSSKTICQLAHEVGVLEKKVAVSSELSLMFCIDV